MGCYVIFLGLCPGSFPKILNNDVSILGRDYVDDEDSHSDCMDSEDGDGADIIDGGRDGRVDANTSGNAGDAATGSIFDQAAIIRELLVDGRLLETSFFWVVSARCAATIAVF